MDKLAKHGHQANKAALYGELCALLFAKSHYDEVCMCLRKLLYLLYIIDGHQLVLLVVIIKYEFVLLNLEPYLFLLFPGIQVV